MLNTIINFCLNHIVENSSQSPSGLPAYKNKGRGMVVNCTDFKIAIYWEVSTVVANDRVDTVCEQSP